MIAWQNVAMLWALPLAAVPVIIHLLRRHHADRIPFPSLRFVRSAQSAAVRIRRPSDPLLLIVRMAAVAFAVIAAAGPILLSDARLDRWNRETARAVVVDASDSMRAGGADGVTPERLASDAAVAEAQSARYTTEIRSDDLPRGIRRAAAWLAGAPPAKREVVVISDFQRGGFDERAIANVDRNVGIRLIQVGRPVSQQQMSGPDLLGGGGLPGRSQTIDQSGDATGVTFSALVTERRSGGLRLVPTDPSSERLVRVVAAAGTPAPSPDEPIVIQFAANTATATKLDRVRTGWMLRTLLRFQDEAMRLSADAGTAVRQIGESSPWSVLVRDSAAKPLVSAAASGDELVLDVAVPTDSFFAAFVVHSILASRRAPADLDEREISRLDSATLSALGRAAASIELETMPHTAWRQASTDSRWCWATVLLMLGIEQALRARAVTSSRVEGSRVAT